MDGAITGDSLENRASSLVLTAWRRQRLSELVALCHRERPNGGFRTVWRFRLKRSMQHGSQDCGFTGWYRSGVGGGLRRVCAAHPAATQCAQDFLDISEWQGDIDPEAMKAADVSAVIVRASYGQWQDGRVIEYVAQLQAACCSCGGPVP